MTDIVRITKRNDTYMHIDADAGVLYEIRDAFTFMVPNAKFHPRVKAGVWDGKISLIQFPSCLMYVGLLNRLKQHLNRLEYKVEVDPLLEDLNPLKGSQTLEFIRSLNITSDGKPIEPRDYQLAAIHHCLKNKRQVILSPTACLDPDEIIDVIVDDVHSKIALKNLDHLIKNKANVFIDTPSGSERITDVYSKYGNGVVLYFDDGTELKCANNHLLFCEDESTWVEAINATVGQIFNGKILLEVEPLSSPQNWIDFSIGAEHESYYHKGLLHHNSGKSFIIYCIARYIMSMGGRVLIIVPNVGLVRQMWSDFNDYSNFNGFADEHVQMIADGASKVVEKSIVVSTWQSLYKLPASWFKSFGDSDGAIGGENGDVNVGGILVDEVHLAAAESIKGIMEKAINVPYRCGFTGTLTDAKTNEMVINGLFGEITRVASTKDLMDKGHIAELKIKALVLKYQDKDECKLIRDINNAKALDNKKAEKYAKELLYVINHPRRLKFTSKLAISCKGNTLILVNQIEHAKAQYEQIRSMVGDRKVFLIYGSVDGEDRDEIRKLVEKENDAIIVATFGVLSVGTSIKRLHNVICASPTKSMIRILQSIGRGLRKAHDKTECNWYEIVDLFWKTSSKSNYCYQHFINRLEIYSKEEFNYTIKELDF